MKYFILFLIYFSVFKLFSQSINSTYHSPLEIPLIISANFGELRPNHFHMGLDFKTNGKEGVKILSIEDGYISRVKISPYGYGKVVYIDHPNGVTSVYAHCSSLLGKLDSIVKITQEKEQNFEVELFLKKDEIIVKRGENFALSGNSGSSTAPHLHFELRNTQTETAINPLIFGFDNIDSKAPIIKNIKVYNLTPEGYRIKEKSKTIPVLKGKSNYYINNNVINISDDFCTNNNKNIGFAFDVVDHYNQAENPLGIYGSYLIVNQDTIFGQKIDSVSFDATRQINTHTDYEEFTINHKKFHKSFKTKNNTLPIYRGNSLGVINLVSTDTLDVKYIVFDSKFNKSELDFKVFSTFNNNENLTKINHENFILPDSSIEIKNEKISLCIPKNCVFEPILNNIKFDETVTVGDQSIPTNKPIMIKLVLNKNENIEKYYIAANSKYLPTNYSNGWLTTESKYLGKYSIKIDTIPPVVTPLNFSKNDTIIKKEILQWKIIENKSVLKDYDLFIDGNWVLLAYESKGTYAYFKKPKDLIGKHLLKLIAKDACGNISFWEKELIFE